MSRGMEPLCPLDGLPRQRRTLAACELGTAFQFFSDAIAAALAA